ncbi:hypothetical protein [Flavobacterium soli]|uniref:hypothetical protein n=1 Tax=Flavobacterium soli TaxID=344881 RepID=UPI00041039A3|nr:hypothetical protein [Flavobacterium soli]
MKEIIQPIIGILVVVFVWYVFRSIAKTFSKINVIEENQEDITDLLREIKEELKELNKNNSEKKL